MAINFFEEGVFSGIQSKNKTKRWLKKIAESKGFKIKTLNYVFCNDEYLYDINVQYLNHYTYTDILTFDQSEKKNIIEGDIYISAERVKENAIQVNVDYHKELLRVVSHGLLHLCGYKDKTKHDSKRMREEENQAIGLFEEMNK